MPAKFGYFNAHGIAQSIRNLLQYAGEEYEERRYVVGPAPDYSKEDWFNEKFTLGLKFPNVPYYINGVVKLTQSLAILRYLGRKHDLFASTDADMQIQDMVEQQLVDLRMGFVMAYMSPNHEQKMKEQLEKLPSSLKLFSDHLGDSKWLLGDKLTYLDFFAISFFTFMRLFKEDCFDAFPNLAEHSKRFVELPNLREYLESEDYKSIPLIPPKDYMDAYRK